MAELAAPFYSANDLNAQPGNAALGGGAQQNPNILPNSGLANTISQLISENASEQEAKKQRIFQQQQAEERYRQDAIMRAQEYAHQDSVSKYKQGQEDIRSVYQNLANGQLSAYNMKDAQGNNMSFQPPSADQDVLSKSADNITKQISSDPSKFTDPDFQKQYVNHNKMVAISGTRAIELAKLKQTLAQTADADEQKNIQGHIDAINKTPLNSMQLPDAYLPKPPVADIIPDIHTAYKDDKGLQSFESDDGDKLGRPNVDYDAIQYATPGSPTYMAAQKNVAAMKMDPIFNNPDAFNEFQNRVNGMRAERGQKPLQIGQVTPDGKIALNPDVRVIGTAMQMTHDGNLKADPDYDPLDDKKTQSEIDKNDAEAQKARNTISKASRGKNGQPIFDSQAVQGVYENVQDGRKRATASMADIPTLNVAAKTFGIDPKDYTIANVPVDETIKHIAAIQAQDAKDKPLPISIKPSQAFYIKSKSGDVDDDRYLIAYPGAAKSDSKTPSTKWKIVPVKEAVSNSVTSHAGYKVKPEYVDRAQQAFDDAVKTTPTPKSATTIQPKTTRPTNIPSTAVMVKGYWVDRKNRKVFNSSGEEVKPQ